MKTTNFKWFGVRENIHHSRKITNFSSLKSYFGNFFQKITIFHKKTEERNPLLEEIDVLKRKSAEHENKLLLAGGMLKELYEKYDNPGRNESPFYCSTSIGFFSNRKGGTNNE